MDEEPHFLGIGTGGDSLSPPLDEAVAESPTAAEYSIYDTAYQEEVERIRAAQGEEATIYLTRRVDSNKERKADENIVEVPGDEGVQRKGWPHEEFKNVPDEARENGEGVEDAVAGVERGWFEDIVQLAIQKVKIAGEEAKVMGTKVVEKTHAIL